MSEVMPSDDCECGEPAVLRDVYYDVWMCKECLKAETKGEAENEEWEGTGWGWRPYEPTTDELIIGERIKTEEITAIHREESDAK